MFGYREPRLSLDTETPRYPNPRPQCIAINGFTFKVTTSNGIKNMNLKFVYLLTQHNQDRFISSKNNPFSGVIRTIIFYLFSDTAIDKDVFLVFQPVLLQQGLLPLLDAQRARDSRFSGFNLYGPVDNLVLSLREPDFEGIQFCFGLHLRLFEADGVREMCLLLFRR